MSIIPAGNRREQVAQGPLKNQGILDNVLFNKVAIAPGALGGEDQKMRNEPNQGAPSGVGDAMMQGGLNGPGQADQQEKQVDPMNQNPASPEAVAPAGAGLSPFLQMTPQEPAQEQQNPILNQMEQIEQMLQGTGFGFDLQEKGNGKHVIELIPMQGAMMPRDHYKKILNNLGQLGFNATRAKLPANDPSNESVYMEYTLGSDKVMKPGNRR